MDLHVANGLGDSLESPSEEQMATFLRDIDASDEEHGAAWLSTDAGVSLEWNGDGRLVFSADDDAPPRHLRDVSRERALELWIALARGNVDEIERCAWQPGNGYVRTAEQDARLREGQLRQDRAFYDLLGVERRGVPCRSDGCTRGAVEFSVHCRVHHFEVIQRRACPFDD